MNKITTCNQFHRNYPEPYSGSKSGCRIKEGRKLISLPVSKIVVLLTLAVCFAVPASGQDEDIRQAIQGALKEASVSLKQSGIQAGVPISSLPIHNDKNGYVESQIKLGVTDAGLQYVEGKTDPFWDEVLSEVAWNTRKADMMDQKTLVTFGKLKASKILIYGTVRAAEKTGRRVYAEIELHASSLETKEHLWGGNFAKRIYLPGPEPIYGITDIPSEIRDPMKAQLGSRVADSLKRASEKLSPIKTVAFVPLAGDVDQYVTLMMRDAISGSHLNPKGLDLNTLGEARMLLRDQPVQADALLYGAVRDISQKLSSRTFASTTWLVEAEIQSCIEDSTSNEVLWSDTITVSEVYTSTMTKWEVWSEIIYPYLVVHPLIWVLPLAILAGLIVIFRLIRANTRVR
ncbi:MAG: hypothetical protein GX804_01630 [Lentisphaerae bacterium]|nr:hypothetical protein [Lentisphaerota bacterium]